MKYVSSVYRSWLFVSLCASACIACQANTAPQPAPTWERVCIDDDQDGHGFQCEQGDDCDDSDPSLQEGCRQTCRKPNEGCPCGADSRPTECAISPSLSASGSLLCGTGTRYCRDGTWSGCEGIKTFAVPPSGSLLGNALLNDDAGLVMCSPCRPDCYRVDDTLSSPDAGLGAGLVAAPSGIRRALNDRRVRVITVNSANDAHLAEQAKVLSAATGASDVAGTPLTFAINSDGTGMGAAVIDAVNLLAGNLAMDVGVVLNPQPDRPMPAFGFQVEAVDSAGDLCDPPIDTDADMQHLPDTHVNCRPGAAPRFRVRFTNPEAPNHVRPNPTDLRGGYAMKLDLIGDGTYVVDQIPVYILPEDVVPNPPRTSYVSSATYEQILGAPACSDGNDSPIWSALHWSATMPSGTRLRWEACTADSEQAAEQCMPRLLAEVRAGAECEE